MLDANKFCVQLGQQKTGYLLVFNTLVEVQRAFNFVKKARENQLEIYKIRKYDIKINVDFFIMYFGRLDALETDLKKVVLALYAQAQIVRPTDKRSHFRKFSMLFNNYMIAFHGKTNMESRFLVIFLKIFQNFFFEEFIAAVIKNKMRKVR